MTEYKSKKFFIPFAPIISTCILTAGNTFYTTYTTLELDRMGQSNFAIGIISAAYFTGMLLGAYFTQRFILRLGHIYSYTLFAILMAMGVMLQSVFYDPKIWSIARFICGYSLAVLFIVVESWCIESASTQYKSLSLSIYLFAYYLVQAAGQLLLNIPFSTPFLAFSMISIFIILSMAPLCITNYKISKRKFIDTLSPCSLFKRAPLGIWAAIAAGMILASVYTIYPLFLKQIGASIDMISYVMFAIIIGGISLQIPIGKLSDSIDRRFILLIILTCSVVVSILICVLQGGVWLLSFYSFFLGGLTFMLYPLSITYTCSHFRSEQLVGVIGILAFFCSFGSVLGPLLTTCFVSVFGAYGLFISIGLICSFMIVYIVWQIRNFEHL